MRISQVLATTLLTLQFLSCNGENTSKTSQGQTILEASKENVSSQIGKLNDEEIKEFMATQEFDPKGVSFLSLPGASQFLRKFDIRPDEVQMIGSWYTVRDESSGWINMYPNRTITLRYSGPDTKLLGFIGFWKVVEGKVMVKAIGYFYSDKTRDDLIGQRQKEIENPDLPRKSWDLFDYAKLYRYQNSEWKEFFDLKDLDEENYTYHDFKIPPIPSSLAGRPDVALPTADVRRMRLTSDPVMNHWKAVIENPFYAKKMPEDASDGELMEFFKR